MAVKARDIIAKNVYHPADRLNDNETTWEGVAEDAVWGLMSKWQHVTLARINCISTRENIRRYDGSYQDGTPYYDNNLEHLNTSPVFDLHLDIPYNEIPDRLEVMDMATRLADMGPETVILTGVSFEENNIGAVAYSRSKDKIVEYFTERIPKNYHGTGDVFSSVLVAKLVSGQPVYECLKAACDFVVEAIKETIPDSEHVYGVKFEHVLAKERL